MTTSTNIPITGVGGGNVNATTKTALISLAEADGLTPGTIYSCTDGTLHYAITNRFLQPLAAWFVDNRRWSVGSATSPTDLTYCYLPPLAPNAQVIVEHQWSMDGTNVVKRGRIYLDGTLGGGTAGASAVYTRSYADTNVQRHISSKIANQNNASAQQCLTLGDDNSFSGSTSVLVNLTVNTNTSKLLRAMGETSKNSGSPVTISSITRSGSTATVTTGSAHNLISGDYVGIFGANQTEYNVDPAQVTYVSSTQFTYPVSGTPATPATTGTSLTFQKYVNLALVSFRVTINQGLGF